MLGLRVNSNLIRVNRNAEQINPPLSRPRVNLNPINPDPTTVRLTLTLICIPATILGLRVYS